MRALSKTTSNLCLALAFSLIIAGILCTAGCGSADIGGYKDEVTDINGCISRELNEIFENEAHSESNGPSDHIEQASQKLVEASEALEEAYMELQGIKVPAGWEDFHYELLSLYHVQAEIYSQLGGASSPEEEHGEGH
jgi:hypothetical protein